MLSRGLQWPSAAVGVLYNLPHELTGEVMEALCDLDEQAAGNEDPAVAQLRVGIVAVLARSNNEQAMKYLRAAWDKEPERRMFLAMGLAQQPGGENYEYLLRSLPVVEGAAAQEVLVRLAAVDRKPEEPEAIREVILLGLSLKDQGANEALALLQRWNPQAVPQQAGAWKDAPAAWQQWYAQQYPERPAAELPVSAADEKWDFHDLLTYLTKEGSHGSAERGALVFQSAGCAKCHRLGSQGERVGPDLTSVAQRLTTKEILESILYPSHRLGPEHMSTTLVTTTGRTYSGLTHKDATGRWTVLQNTGAKVTLSSAEVQDTSPSKESAMRRPARCARQRRDRRPLRCAATKPTGQHRTSARPPPDALTRTIHPAVPEPPRLFDDVQLGQLAPCVDRSVEHRAGGPSPIGQPFSETTGSRQGDVLASNTSSARATSSTDRSRCTNGIARRSANSPRTAILTPGRICSARGETNPSSRRQRTRLAVDASITRSY